MKSKFKTRFARAFVSRGFAFARVVTLAHRLKTLDQQ